MFKDDPVTTVSAPPRRHWRFWLLFVGIPVLVLIVSGVVWMFRASAGLQAAIDEADRLDPRWRLEEIEADRASPMPGQNAADRILAIRLLRPPRPWLHFQTGRVLDELQPANQLNDEQIAAVKAILAPEGPAIAEARRLIDMPGRYTVAYAPDWFSTLFPTLDDSRMLSYLLKIDAYDKAQAGDADGAVRSCQAVLNAGASIGDEPSMIAQITRYAVQAVAVTALERVLAQGEPSDAVLAAVQARLAAIEPDPLLLYGLRGDRAGINQFFDNVRNDTIPVSTIAAVMGQRKIDASTEALLRVPGYVATQQTAYLHYTTELIQIAKLPPERWADPLAAQAAKANELPAFARLLVGFEFKFAKGCGRNHANLRCAIVAIACERYRRTNGHWPATPDDLVTAGLLKSVPGDPFAAGQRIKFARRPDGLTVYSVGEDGIDDGGNLTRVERGIGADLGFRLWDVTARRQPPIPPKP